MQGGQLGLQIFAPGKADVYLASEDAAIPWGVVEALDRASICVVGHPPEMAAQHERALVIASECSGVVTVAPARVPLDLAALGILTLETRAGGPVDLEGFLAAVLKDRERTRPYAFLVGRLERDFRQAREAIRVAVEGEAGIPCLWSDDGRHRTNLESVREQTRLLIQSATFVIAELTLGVESPERENPSRAHEIGMAIAYERPLMLCSQEPRRYPYFSIGDRQMAFWSTEDELGAVVRAWIRASRESVARRVFNYELALPTIARPSFSFDPALRYVGPRTRLPFDVRRLLAAAGLKRS